MQSKIHISIFKQFLHEPKNSIFVGSFTNISHKTYSLAYLETLLEAQHYACAQKQQRPKFSNNI